ncbi:MAG: hypothetical protein M0Q53_17590 [Prolixibacteraceae bacterium]|jgi:hypothetical protein|nr:hypothetical protein [Prolixibacteraceae bacterium]
MAISKIDFTFENLHFSCKGDNAWVEKQLNNVLSRIPSLLAVHKMGETIVEDVIEVNPEDEKDEAIATDATPPVAERASKTSREKKAKVDKVPKVKVDKRKVVKEPKIKTAKVPKVAKVPKIKIVKEPKALKVAKEKSSADSTLHLEGEAPKRGRKPKIGGKAVDKQKKAKKKIEGNKPVVEQIDSPLSQFIADKKATTNQVRKFLATAVFLSRSNSVSKLSTSMISRALKSYGIEKLQNASDCLNKNEKKGYCIKDGKEFIITENGYLSIE